MTQQPVLIILAGGASSRMWPLREKSLIRFGEKPLMLTQLERYRALGFTQVVIVGNPENEADVAALAATVPGLDTRVVVQPEAKGMGDALLKVEPVLADPHTPIYITQVHDVVDDTLHEDMLKGFRADPSATYIAGYEMEEYFPGGYLIVDAAGRISGMVEKPGAANRPSKLVTIVAHIHADAAQLMQAIREEYASDKPGDDHYERAMDGLMKQMVYKAVPYKGTWRALKFPWHVLDIMNVFLDQLKGKGQQVAESAFVAKTASLVGDVVIGEGAKVFPGAAVVGPAYIGAHTIVGNNALVRNSMVLEYSNVGFTTEIARSYVADHVDMHACRVLDSVFAPYVNFSAGCTTANLRIDRGAVPSTVKGQRVDSGRDKLGAMVGQGAFIAVDAMTMPGVKIGEGAEIGPGTHVIKDVPNRMRVFVKQELGMVEKE
jgi:UDP-N-acetylglucosamine diphosphorylase / glucose-1-phosphate thymidylyltransferase / UDP-N-acetylgalactosamine diphosphorylase / glucosamine-1-phosphate N-acetyltransferase / galactosamine-1-phosphate N-acetyltransferase